MAHPLGRAVASEDPSWASRLNAMLFCSEHRLPPSDSEVCERSQEAGGPSGRHTVGQHVTCRTAFVPFRVRPSSSMAPYQTEVALPGSASLASVWLYRRRPISAARPRSPGLSLTFGFARLGEVAAFRGGLQRLTALSFMGFR